jgi:hypothetical protein
MNKCTCVISATCTAGLHVHLLLFPWPHTADAVCRFYGAAAHELSQQSVRLAAQHECACVRMTLLLLL